MILAYVSVRRCTLSEIAKQSLDHPANPSRTKLRKRTRASTLFQPIELLHECTQYLQILRMRRNTAHCTTRTRAYFQRLRHMISIYLRNIKLWFLKRTATKFRPSYRQGLTRFQTYTDTSSNGTPAYFRVGPESTPQDRAGTTHGDASTVPIPARTISRGLFGNRSARDEPFGSGSPSLASPVHRVVRTK